jgi:prepilin-type N-terminal cleavage/methylation domain-containing protein
MISNTNRARGFSLLEIAIVLILVGLLLGGVLKGQELISGARVRSLIQQQDGVKTAYYAFFDRYKALPGDYSGATTQISGISTSDCNGGNGNGDGRIEEANNENTLVWEHLARAGFMTGPYACAAVVSPATSPMNAHGRPLEIVFDTGYAGATTTARHLLKTGSQISSQLLAEIDRKVDDGNAVGGVFRAQTGGGVSTTTTECYDAGGVWASIAPGLNCGGAYLL